MNKIILSLLIFIPFVLQADVFYWPREYNKIYNEKTAIEIELKNLKKQYGNDRNLMNGKIADLENQILILEKKLELEKEGRAGDNKYHENQIKDLEKNIEILQKTSKTRVKELLEQNRIINNRAANSIHELQEELNKEKISCMEKLEALRNEFNQKEKSMQERINSLENELAELKQLTSRQKEQLDRLADQTRQLEEQLKDEIERGEIRLKRLGNKLVINIDEKVSFDSGKSNLKKDVIAALDKIGKILSEYPENRIIIEGHTDNVPIKTVKFPDNWQLSSERALSVLRYLLENKKLNPEKLSIQGYGEYQPVVPNNTPENRALNRRVDIVIGSGI